MVNYKNKSQTSISVMKIQWFKTLFKITECCPTNPEETSNILKKKNDLKFDLSKTEIDSSSLSGNLKIFHYKIAQLLLFILIYVIWLVREISMIQPYPDVSKLYFCEISH